MNGYPPVRSWTQRVWSYAIGALALVVVLNLTWALLRRVLVPVLIGSGAVLAGQLLIRRFRRL